jgi:DNA-binding MarR family transcriptional regulator
MTTDVLSERERLLWHRYNALLTTVPGMLDERMRAVTGLTRYQYGLLDTLSTQPERRLQLADVARATDSSLSRLSHTVTRLEDLGLVERQGCDEDRRATWAVLTDAGAAVVEEARERYTELMREVLLNRIPPSEHQGAIEFLTALLPPDVAAACTKIDNAETSASALEDVSQP